MLDRRKAERLVGETLREIGILVFVFAPLDALYQGPRAIVLAIPWSLGGLFLMTGGIILEVRRSEEQQ